MAKSAPFLAIGALSAAAVGALFYLVYGRSPGANDGTFAFLPGVNAACNAVTTALILLGLYFIHRGDETRHRRCMLGAFGASTLFLIGYIAYHVAHGETRFPGQGWVRPVYFFILISHIIFSVVALPLVLGTFYLALAGRFETHKRLARFTYPVWLYVSVTGVAVYFFLMLSR